ncbi:MAG: prolyl oligopeptidase family serine peptidase, partial [Bacteroidota bacterium]
DAPIEFSDIPFRYPTTFADSTIVDDYHGHRVADPYRWLEEDHAPATKAWTTAQNQLTFSYLAQIPFRQSITQRLEQIWDYERYTPPLQAGDRYYFFKNEGLQNQAVLYALDQLNGTPEVVLDPNQFSTEGTAALGEWSISKNGRYLAFQISQNGSDWRQIRIKDLKTGQLLEETLDWVKFSNISWYEDGFFYSRYPASAINDNTSNAFHQVYYHLLDTPQSDDELIFADRSHPQRGFRTFTTSDERFLLIDVWESTSGNALYFKDLQAPNSNFVPIYEGFDFDFRVIDNIGDKLLVLTNHQANNNRVIRISSQHPKSTFWEEIISEQKDKLQAAYLAGNKMLVHYLHQASSKVQLCDIDGQVEADISLPEIGTVTAFSTSPQSTEAFFAFTSFTRPSSIYRLDLITQATHLFKAPQVDFDASQYETQQVWYQSYDGTAIPMFITHKKGLSLDSRRPTLLYGYGGFDISILPQFNLTRLHLGPIFLENGGVYAVANLRGGGEFGKAWHEAGMRLNKQNVFNDFQAAAEYLIDQNYTSSDKLAIYGRSNGGLLVGACLTQRPDLYAVALPAVGVLDMLRYQAFTIGRAWASDYGLSEREQEFDYLYSYSPLHNAEEGHYPATLVTTADHDDRVVPAHSFKFTATLQNNQKGKAPVFIRVAEQAGHGAGKSTRQKIEEAADMLSFSFYQLKESVIYQQELKK